MCVSKSLYKKGLKLCSWLSKNNNMAVLKRYNYLIICFYAAVYKAFGKIPDIYFLILLTTWSEDMLDDRCEGPSFNPSGGIIRHGHSNGEHLSQAGCTTRQGSM